MLADLIICALVWMGMFGFIWLCGQCPERDDAAPFLSAVKVIRQMTSEIEHAADEQPHHHQDTEHDQHIHHGVDQDSTIWRP